MQSIFFKNEQHTVAERIRYGVFVVLGSIVPLLYFFCSGLALFTPFFALLIWLREQQQKGRLKQKWKLAAAYFICLVVLYAAGILSIERSTDTVYKGAGDRL